MSISPGQATLYSNQAVTLSAAIANVDNKSAQWTMEPAAGRLSATTGASVTYTAPATVAAQQVVTVRATSVEDPTQSATASITLPPPVSVTLTPTSATLAPSQQQAFSATVVNPGGPTDVRWSITPNVGSVSRPDIHIPRPSRNQRPPLASPVDNYRRNHGSLSILNPYSSRK